MLIRILTRNRSLSEHAENERGWSHEAFAKNDDSWGIIASPETVCQAFLGLQRVMSLEQELLLLQNYLPSQEPENFSAPSLKEHEKPEYLNYGC